MHTDASLNFQLKCKEKEKKGKSSCWKTWEEIILRKKWTKKILMRGSEKQGKKCSDPLFHAWIFKILSYELSNFPEVWAAKWRWEKKSLLRKNNCRFSEKCCYKSQVFQVLSLRPKGDFYLKKQNEWIYVFFLCFECGLWTDEDEDEDDKYLNQPLVPNETFNSKCLNSCK